MTSIQVQTTQDDFSIGSNQDVAPHLIDEGGAFEYLNMVLDDDGSAYGRGCSSEFSVNDMDGPGRFLFDGILNVGRRTITADVDKTYVLGSDDETLQELDSAVGMPYPKQTAVMKGLLFIGGGAITGGARSSVTHTVTGQLAVTNGSKIVTRSGGTWLSIVVPGHLLRVGGTGRVYEVASVDSGTSLTLRDNYAGATNTGLNAVFYPIYRHVSGDPYSGDEYVAVSNNRLVFAADRTIRFSDIDNPHSFPAVNFHELPSGAVITGLADLGGRLMVFTTDGIWTIDGLAYNIVDSSGNGQHRVQQLSKDIVLAGVSGIAGYEQQLVVPAADGIYLLDGVSSPVRISRGIERPLRAWWKWGARCGKAIVFRGHYLLPLVSSLGTVKDMFVCRLDRPVKTRFDRASWPWVRFSGDAGETPAFEIRHGSAQLSPQLLGVQGRADARIVDCSDFFNPGSSLATDADGSAPVRQITTRDFESGNLTVNSVRALFLRYELRGAGAVLKVEWGPGGPNYDMAGYSNPLRLWNDPAALWNDADGVWGSGFGPADPDVIDAPTDVPAFEELGPPPGESDGIRPVKVRVNKRTRYSRFRITCAGSVEVFRLRSLQTTVRPSQAVRL